MLAIVICALVGCKQWQTLKTHQADGGFAFA
jgi:hypothetical protein